MHIEEAQALLKATLPTQKAGPYKTALELILSHPALLGTVPADIELDNLMQLYHRDGYKCFGVENEGDGFDPNNNLCLKCERHVHCQRAVALSTALGKPQRLRKF